MKAVIIILFMVYLPSPSFTYDLSKVVKILCNLDKIMTSKTIYLHHNDLNLKVRLLKSLSKECSTTPVFTNAQDKHSVFIGFLGTPNDSIQISAIKSIYGVVFLQNIYNLKEATRCDQDIRFVDTTDWYAYEYYEIN